MQPKVNDFIIMCCCVVVTLFSGITDAVPEVASCLAFGFVRVFGAENNHANSKRSTVVVLMTPSLIYCYCLV